jgi:ABC-type transport system involved in multi-copper enzyme maturation permease subunit
MRSPIGRLRPQINPIIVRELRTRMRGARPYIILTVFLLLLTAAGLGVYALMLQQARFGMALLSAQVGQALFKGLAFCELLLVVFLAPAMTSGSISGEREQLTYDMLIATPLRPGQILWGKLVAALSYLLLLIFAAMPLFSVVFVFGGVEPKALLKALALLLASALTFGAVGLFCSSLLRRTARATTVSYVLVLLLLGSLSLIVASWQRFSSPPGLQPPPELGYLNPFGALLSITTLAPPNDPSVSFLGYGDAFGGLPLDALIAPAVIYYGPNGPLVVPVFRATLLGYALLTTLLCWASAHLVLPHRRWRPRWGDLGFVAALAGLLLLAYMSRGWWHVPAPESMGIVKG